jgi:2-(1,2-epoxy-1,2-dihydrophenyl)acetyl-CoA isomerase
MMEELTDILDSVKGDDGLRALVFTGAGRAFCVGGDLAVGLEELNGAPPLSRQTRKLRSYMRVVQALRDLPQVTIAAINGACAGAGLSLALACDLRIASEQARFNSGFLSAGVSGDFGGIWLATRAIGSAAARSVFLQSEPFGTEQALRIGLVSRATDAEQTTTEALRMAETLVRRAPMALRRMKENLNDAEWMDLAPYLDGEASRHAACVASEDAREAAAAFREKRDPTFVGR